MLYKFFVHSHCEHVCFFNTQKKIFRILLISFCLTVNGGLLLWDNDINFWKKMLMKIFGLNEVSGKFRKVSKKRLYELEPWNQENDDGMAWRELNVHRILVRKPLGKRPLGRRRSRWEDNNKITLEETVRMGGWRFQCHQRWTFGGNDDTATGATLVVSIQG
jgi:hypothetical protein